MRVELDSVNWREMVQNRKIKITYLIVIVFLCVLGVSGAFQAIVIFSSNFTESSSLLSYKVL